MADPKTTTSPTVIVKLDRAHWIGTERHEPPEAIEVGLEDALRLIAAGIASRTDPLRAP